jgi:hypothetical protein
MVIAKWIREQGRLILDNLNNLCGHNKTIFLVLQHLLLTSKEELSNSFPYLSIRVTLTRNKGLINRFSKT